MSPWSRSRWTRPCTTPTCPCADEVRKAADLGYEYLELSPRPDFFFWHRYPKADDAAIAEVKKACKETGVTLIDLVPVFNWSSPDEQERQAQVRNWRGCCRSPPSWNARW